MLRRRGPQETSGGWDLGASNAEPSVGVTDWAGSSVIGHPGEMSKHIDLDEAAAQIAARRDAWVAAGLDVGQLTWREQGEGWPPSFKTARAEVVTADSIGVEVRKGTQEGTLVLFSGGWADLLWWSGEASGVVVDEAPRWNDWLDLDRFGALLDRFASLYE